MKRWYIYSDFKVKDTLVCSLLSHAASAKVSTLMSDCGELVKVHYFKFFDFSTAKSGREMGAWLKLDGVKNKLRCKIVFK